MASELSGRELALYRKIVDIAWNEATESEEVPSTNWADEIIERAEAQLAERQSRESVLRFIATVRESFPKAVNAYTEGSCYRFHLILREVFPQAAPYSNINHVISRIGDRFYDITGEVQADGYLPMEEYGPEYAERQAGYRWNGGDETWVLEAQLSEQRALLRQALEALKPFADGHQYTITVQDLARVREVLNSPAARKAER